jgi:redox-sensing transcriptional repressor
MKEKQLSDLVFERISLYNRCINKIIESTDRDFIDSKEMSKILNLDSSLIRRDLSLIGKIGKRGFGYSLPVLQENIKEFLAKQRIWNVAIIGMGNLGNAILRYLINSKNNYKVSRLFDKDPAKIGKSAAERTIEDFTVLTPGYKIELGIITVPADDAPQVADRLIECGAEGILNFAPVRLNLPSRIYYREIDVIRELDILGAMISFYSK